MINIDHLSGQTGWEQTEAESNYITKEFITLKKSQAFNHPRLFTPLLLIIPVCFLKTFCTVQMHQLISSLLTSFAKTITADLP